MNKNISYKKIISYFEGERNLTLNEADIAIILKEGCFKNLNELESWVIEEDNVKVFKNMNDLLSWQFDNLESLSDAFNTLLTCNIHEIVEFSKNRNDIVTLADFYHYKNEDSQRIYLTNGKVAYIYG